MAKAIKSALIAALVVFVVATTGGVGASAFSAFGLTGAAAMAAVTFATTLLSAGIAQLTSKGIEANQGNLGTKVTTRNATAPRQIVYGETLVGGTILHMQTGGSDNSNLHMIAVVAGHEIQSLEALRINGTDVILNTHTSTSTISGETVHKVNLSQFKNTDNDNKLDSTGTLIRFTFHNGSQTSADGLARANLGSSIPSTHVYTDCAYIYMQMVYDPEKLAQPPTVAYKVKGKKCYDPRDGTTAWTDNPALIIRDYLSNSTFGMKAGSSELNDTSNAGGFSSAANTCEQTVSSDTGGGSEKRYTTNGFTNMSAAPDGVLEGFLSSCAGKITYVNGKFNLFVGASQTPSLTITDDKVLSPPSASTRPQSGDLYNTVKPIYVDASNNYTGTDGGVYQDSGFLAADTPTGESSANYIKQLEVQYPYTTTATMADRLAKIALRHSRQTTQITLLTTLEFMKLQPQDWVYVTNERLGFTNKIFQVQSTNLEMIADGDVPVAATRLSLKEIATSVFNHAANEYVPIPTEGDTVPAGDMTVTAPTGLTLSQILVKEGGTSKINIQASWSNNSSPYIRITEIGYKLSGDSDYTGIVVGAGVDKARIQNVAVGETYNIRVRHQNIYDVYSAYTSVSNITIVAATEAPTAPSNLTASTLKELNILITFTNSNSADMKAVKIYRKTANVTPTSDTDGLVHTMSGVNGQVSTWLDGKFNGLTAGTTYYYWAKAINTSDVASSLVGPVGGSFSDIADFQINNGDITNAMIAVDAIQANVIKAGTITATEIGANAVTTAKLANDAVTDAVVAAGAIGTSELGVDAVTSAKIADNAVTAAQIGADAVTTAKIANDAITTDLIAAGAITATEIGADAVTTAKIANDAITTDLIAAGAITATEIGADAVTTAKIANDAITEDLIAAGAVTTTTIADDAISTAKIAANAITATEIAANAITANEIAANAITASEISAGAITATELAANSVTANEIAANAVTASEIAANTITAANIAANAITAGEIEAGSITATELAANSVTASEIAANAVTASEIAADTITAANIAANAITATEIAAGAVTATEIAADTITASQIAADAITANEIAANAVTADAISANTITSAEIAANAITASEIAANAVTANAIAANTITAGEIEAGAISATEIAANAITAAKIAANTITASEIEAGTITASEIATGAITAVKVAAGAITATKIGANAVTAAKINVANLAALSADMGTITAGSITAGTVAATTLNLNGATLSADANGLTLNVFDAFSHINTGTMGKIGGISGQNEADNGQNITATEIVRSIWGDNNYPHHLSGVNSTSSNPTVSVGTVMGNGASNTPLFAFNFTTPAFSGTKEYIVQTGLEYTGTNSSGVESVFAVAMRATTSSSAFTSTSRSDYIFTDETGSSGSFALGARTLNASVNLSGSTQYYIWCFGYGDDGIQAYKSGFINVFGLNV